MKDAGKDWHQYYAVGTKDDPMSPEYLRKCVEAYALVVARQNYYYDAITRGEKRRRSISDEPFVSRVRGPLYSNPPWVESTPFHPGGEPEPMEEAWW